MAALGILGQKAIVAFDGGHHVITKLRHDGAASNTFTIDQSADSVAAFNVAGNTAPTVSLGTASSSTFLKTVTIANGTAGIIEVVTRHPGPVASVKA